MMITTPTIGIDDIRPSLEQILAGQKIPAERLNDGRTAALATEAQATLNRLAEPVSLVAEVGLDEFADIYPGDGMNLPETPLEYIYPSARCLSLFATTVGAPICREITELFDRQEFAAAAMLDAAASAGAELAVETITRLVENNLRATDRLGPAHAVLPFSPGYCGWHVSGQKRLFERLRPDTIGIALSDSCLMEPLKSVSGVMVAASITAFDIDDTYPFCADCETHSCQSRYRELREIRKAP